MNNMNDKETDMKLHDELKKTDAATHADAEKKKIKSALESMMFVWARQRSCSARDKRQVSVLYGTGK